MPPIGEPVSSSDETHCNSPRVLLRIFAAIFVICSSLCPQRANRPGFLFPAAPAKAARPLTSSVISPGVERGRPVIDQRSAVRPPRCSSWPKISGARNCYQSSTPPVVEWRAARAVAISGRAHGGKWASPPLLTERCKQWLRQTADPQIAAIAGRSMRPSGTA